MHPLLYIPFQRREGNSGPSRFRQNLKRHLALQKIPYLKKPDKAKILFFPTSCPIEMIEKVKANGGRVIQRLDGVYYPSKHGEGFEVFNAVARKIYCNYADFVVFQSNYSKEQCFSMFGDKPDSKYRIICNGADTKYFYPALKMNTIQSNKRVRLITTGYFRNLDMLEPVIKACDVLKDTFNLELVVLGPINNEGLIAYSQRNYITHKKTTKLHVLANELRKSHIFIYSHLNPPCPNSVVEAISCGLPVVGFDSGAMRELLPFGIDLLAWVSNDLFQKYEDFKFEKLAEKISFAIEKYAIVKERAMAHSHLYPFDECGEKYISLFSRMHQELNKGNVDENRIYAEHVTGMSRR
ncbi:MAG: glycosyltransferase family 4 protein [Candidatus Omnitrophica bacterium]|nr:glycosyltransferase family 4 protein [Candidatus Omnitrophota bacterium]